MRTWGMRTLAKNKGSRYRWHQDCWWRRRDHEIQIYIVIEIYSVFGMNRMSKRKPYQFGRIYPRPPRSPPRRPPPLPLAAVVVGFVVVGIVVVPLPMLMPLLLLPIPLLLLPEPILVPRPLLVPGPLPPPLLLLPPPKTPGKMFNSEFNKSPTTCKAK